MPGAATSQGADITLLVRCTETTPLLAAGTNKCVVSVGKLPGIPNSTKECTSYQYLRNEIFPSLSIYPERRILLRVFQGPISTTAASKDAVIDPC